MSLFSFFKSTIAKGPEVKSAPDGLCPNCWGRQEFGGQFYDSVKVEGIDTNNIDSKKGWVLAYAEVHLTGIRLREDDAQLVCNNCKMRYEKNQ